MPGAQEWRLSWKSHFRGCIRCCETSTQPPPCTRNPLEGETCCKHQKACQRRINISAHDTLQVSTYFVVHNYCCSYIFTATITAVIIINISSQEIYQDPASEHVAAQFPSLYTIQSSLYRSRRDRSPPMPTSRSECDLTGEWCKIIGGEEFVLANDISDDKIVLFKTVENLLHLEKAEVLFIALASTS